MKPPAASASNGRGSRWFHLASLVLAAVFAAATLLYTYFWLAAIDFVQPASVELGFASPYQRLPRAFVVTSVIPGSPAESAGLRAGDEMVAFDGRRVEGPRDQQRVWKLHQPGDSVRLTVQRPGQAAPLELTGIFRRNSQTAGAPGSLREAASQLLRSSLPIAFAAVGLVILLLRPEDRNVWLLACFFAGIIATSGFPDDFAIVPGLLRPWMEIYKGLFLGLLGASFYCLCSVFPARSPMDRRLPWLKWVAVALGLAAAGEMELPDVSHPAAILSRLMGAQAAERFSFGVTLALLALGLVSLAGNYFFAREGESRRKIRVIFWGTVVGLGPPLVRAGAQQYVGFQSPAWLEMIMNAVLLLVPASFAYAVFKQRVLEIPVLLRRSVRYVLVQRGFLFLLCFVSFGLTLLFASSLGRLPLIEARLGQSGGVMLGAVFGTALMWGGSQVHRQVGGKIDRAFFRSAYDARVILENLAEKSRAATGREALAQLLYSQLKAALQPASLAVYLESRHDELNAAAGEVAAGFQTIGCNSPLLVELARRGEPWEPPPARPGEGMGVAPFEAGCLVPILGRDGKLVGLLALGPRLSEEPYSGEDKRLLASVAGQAGMAIENFRLAEDIAEKLEAERRAAREMEIAKDVQSRLLPQTAPELKTLECAGRCLQAWRVGGDYYDFLELSRDQVGLVLADVSGKGVHAALLMANLQAHFRSLNGLARGAAGLMSAADLVRTLQEVNQIMWKSTAAQHYATLFFGLYNDGTRCLTYVNCGHNPPILVRGDGSIERLKATATVIGLFEKWECAACETELKPGDLLVIFSDGVTEAMRGEEEFGEGRLLDLLREVEKLPVEQLVTNVFRSVQEFSEGNQSDDLTLVVARVKGE